jgi:hypothetical protein
MKHIRNILIYLPIFLAGCVVRTDHHYPQLPSEPTESTNTGDIFNPLTPAELELVRTEIDHLQPYMTLNDCIAALRIPRREVPTTVWGPRQNQSISMQLRADHVLLLVRDGRNYVISAQLDEKKWQWPNYHKSP